MTRLRSALLLWFTTAELWSQPRPILIEGRCTPEVIQSLSLPCSADEPCPLFLELAAAEPLATRLILTGNLHTGAQTVESVLLISDDGGRSWTEAHPRIPGAVLDQIQFFDFESGWVNGHILQATPKDAFFLLTTDGGKTWRRRPVTGESRTGAVEQFWFDSKTHGLLSLDRVRAAENGLRYELWESQTGGESWSVRQVDAKPPSFARPQREPLMRIRTDRDGKTHRLERREGAKWVQAAAFLVSAGECRPPFAEADRLPPPPTVIEEPAAASAADTNKQSPSAASGDLRIGADGVVRPAESAPPKGRKK